MQSDCRLIGEVEMNIGNRKGFTRGDRIDWLVADHVGLGCLC